MPELSVILCTHNPRPEYLRRTLEALAAQTLPKNRWELLLIDNASDVPLTNVFDLSWHPYARVMRENQLGLTPARLRGIRETATEILVFVDDDNLLDADYLRHVQELDASHPYLGAWGGSQIGEFESVPPVWAQPYLGFLAVREITGEIWSNDPRHSQATPYGAGLCVRRKVAAAYAEQTDADPLRLALDRQGENLMSGGDLDLAHTSHKVGLGFGVFERLRLIHLIPGPRLRLEYLAALVRGSTASAILLDHREGIRRPARHSKIGGVLQTIYDWLRLSKEQWRLRQAEAAAKAVAERILAGFSEK